MSDKIEQIHALTTSANDLVTKAAGAMDDGLGSPIRNLAVYDPNTSAMLNHVVPNSLFFGAGLAVGLADSLYIYYAQQKLAEQNTLDYVLRQAAQLDKHDIVDPAKVNGDLLTQITVLQNMRDAYRYHSLKTKSFAPLRTYRLRRRVGEARLEMMLKNLEQLASNETPHSDNTITSNAAAGATSLESIIAAQATKVSKLIADYINPAPFVEHDGEFFERYRDRYDIEITTSTCSAGNFKFGEISLLENAKTRRAIEQIRNDDYKENRKRKNRVERFLKRIAESKFGKIVGATWDALTAISLIYWIGWFGIWFIRGIETVVRRVAIALTFGIPAILPTAQLLTHALQVLEQSYNFYKANQRLKKLINLELKKSNSESKTQKNYKDLTLAEFAKHLANIHSVHSTLTEPDPYNIALIEQWLQKIALYYEPSSNKIAKEFAEMTVSEFEIVYKKLAKRIAQQKAIDTFALQRGLFIKLQAEHAATLAEAAATTAQDVKAKIQPAPNAVHSTYAKLKSLPDYALHLQHPDNHSRRTVFAAITGGMTGFIGTFFVGWVLTAFLSSVGVAAAGGPVAVAAVIAIGLVIGIAYGFYKATEGSRLYKKGFNAVLKNRDDLEKVSEHPAKLNLNLDTLEMTSEISKSAKIRSRLWEIGAGLRASLGGWSGSLFNRAFFQSGSVLSPAVVKPLLIKFGMASMLAAVLAIIGVFATPAVFIAVGIACFAIYGGYKVLEYYKNQQDLKSLQHVERAHVMHYLNQLTAEQNLKTVAPVESTDVDIIVYDNPAHLFEETAAPGEPIARRDIEPVANVDSQAQAPEMPNNRKP